jgi:hypothetical protein
MLDFALLASAWLSRPGDYNWNPDCDISKPTDNLIDYRDLAVFAENWLDYSQVPDFYYYSSGQKIPLTLSTEKLAVRFNEGVTLEQQEAIVESEENLWPFWNREELLIFDIIYFFFREGVTEEDVIRTINSLNIWSEVEFANPVFYTPDAPDTELTLTDEFLVKFEASVSEAEIEAFNTLHNVEIVEESQLPYWYLLRVKDPKNINTLKTANLYYEDPITVCSAPNFIIRMPYP